MKELQKKRIRFDLQLFAEESTAVDTEVMEKEKTEEAGTKQTLPAGEKTFTQAEVSSMMAKEKNQGKLSILKELGIEDAPTAKAALAKYKEYTDSQKTETEKLNEALVFEKTSKTAMEQKVLGLERRFEVIGHGVAADKADDVVLLAASKVTETKDFKVALEEVKSTYPNLFVQGVGSTGSNVGGKKIGVSGKGSLGTRLAENAAKNQVKNSDYFTN